MRGTSAMRSMSAVHSTPGVIAVRFEWLDERLPGASALGQPRRVRVSVVAARPAGPLNAEVYAHAGLVVSPMHWTLPGLHPHESAERILTVTPYAAGPLRFSVLVQGEVEGQAQAAQITVPVPGEDVEHP